MRAGDRHGGEPDCHINRGPNFHELGARSLRWGLTSPETPPGVDRSLRRSSTSWCVRDAGWRRPRGGYGRHPSPPRINACRVDDRTDHLDAGLSGPRVAGAAIGRQRIIPAARSPVSRRFVLEEHAIDRKVVRLAVQTAVLHPAVRQREASLEGVLGCVHAVLQIGAGFAAPSTPLKISSRTHSTMYVGTSPRSASSDQEFQTATSVPAGSFGASGVSAMLPCCAEARQSMPLASTLASNPRAATPSGKRQRTRK